MRHFSTEALIRWVIQWDKLLDEGYPHQRRLPATPLYGRMFWDLADAKGAAITELLRRGVCSSRWGYMPPWGWRCVPR